MVEILDRLTDVQAEFSENMLQRYRLELIRRGWVRVDGYLKYHMVDFHGVGLEVEIEIDEAADVYRYQNPQNRRHMVVAHLSEVSCYKICLDRWLEDLIEFIGIEPSRISAKREQLPGHLWHLGEVRVGDTHRFAQVYIARRSQDPIRDQIKAVLDDKVDPGNGILFVDSASKPKAFGDHIERCFADLVEFDGSQSTFNTEALDRILMRYASIKAEDEPPQYFEGNRLRLTHFEQSMVLTEEQAKVIKHMWGATHRLPPVMSWSEVNKQAKTGYQSFDDAFGGQVERELVIEKVVYGKYRVRRTPIQNT